MLYLPELGLLEVTVSVRGARDLQVPTYPCIEQVLKKPIFISLYRKLTLAVTLDFVRSIKEPSLEAPSGQLKKLLKDLSSLKDAFKEFVDELKIPYSSSNSGQKALPI